jgi:hypothetical protein
VAKADAKIFNKASQVVLARHDDKTVITMANDFQGDPKEFAVVIPVPTSLEKEQIHIGDRKIIDHLDAYTSPRLVEYFDQNPCQITYWQDGLAGAKDEALRSSSSLERSLGVTVEAEYTSCQPNKVEAWKLG